MADLGLPPGVTLRPGTHRAGRVLDRHDAGILIHARGFHQRQEANFPDDYQEFRAGALGGFDRVRSYGGYNLDARIRGRAILDGTMADVEAPSVIGKGLGKDVGEVHGVEQFCVRRESAEKRLSDDERDDKDDDRCEESLPRRPD